MNFTRPAIATLLLITRRECGDALGGVRGETPIVSARTARAIARNAGRLP
jgi:hypothetical protein